MFSSFAPKCHWLIEFQKIWPKKIWIIFHQEALYRYDTSIVVPLCRGAACESIILDFIVFDFGRPDKNNDIFRFEMW